MEKKVGKKMFWGIILITIGVLIVLNHLFGINLPIIKILFGLFLIYLGLNVIFGSFGMKFGKIRTSSSAVFTESAFTYPPQNADKEYQTVFGNGTLDLSDVQLGEEDEVLELNVAFGNLEVLVNPSMPLEAKVETAFAKVSMPDKSYGALGEFKYTSDTAKQAKAKLILKIHSAFGNVRVRNKL